MGEFHLGKFHGVDNMPIGQFMGKFSENYNKKLPKKANILQKKCQ